MIGIVGGVWIAATHAAPVSVKVCVDASSNFTAIGPDTDFGWNVNTIRPFRGIWLEVCDVNLPSSCPIATWTLDVGQDRGCSTATFDTAKTYRVIMHSDAKIGGRRIKGRLDTPLPPPLTGWASQFPVVTVLDAGWTPLINQPSIRRTAPWTTLNAQLQVAGWMFFRNQFGISTSTDLWMVQGRPGTFSNMTGVFADTTSKHVISHEIGHWIGNIRDGGVCNVLYDLDMQGCYAGNNPTLAKTVHEAFSLEWQSTAACEGFADFIVAWAWNSQAQDDCVIHEAPGNGAFLYDFDRDGVFDLDDNDQWSCAGFPWDTNNNGTLDADEADVAGWVSADDWLADYKVNKSQFCTASLFNKGHRAGWTRFFWALMQEEGLSDTKVVDLFDHANGDTWIEASTQFPQSCPTNRLFDACDVLNISTECDNQAGRHGIFAIP